MASLTMWSERPVSGIPVLRHVGEPAREVRPRGHEQGVVVEAGVVLHRERRGLLVEHEEVVAAGSRGVAGAVARARGSRPSASRVPAQRALEVGDGQVDGPTVVSGRWRSLAARPPSR
jgi:hypothetical protein